MHVIQVLWFRDREGILDVDLPFWPLLFIRRDIIWFLMEMLQTKRLILIISAHIQRYCRGREILCVGLVLW